MDCRHLSVQRIEILRYGKTADCIAKDFPDLRVFCHCVKQEVEKKEDKNG